MTTSFDASEIDHWSDTAEAAHKLSVLIRRLVMATLPEPPSRIDIPGGSSVRLPGWDGILETASSNAWVPRGISGWEISCDKQVTNKANVVYEKRAEDSQGLDKADATFVFVTSRRWPQKRQWERERQNEGLWLKVRALDADDLVAWLEQSPEVTQWLSEEIHKIPLVYREANRIEQIQSEV